MQSREVQLGGGFMSFDAPDVHFGLGVADIVEQVLINWPDGATDTIGPMPAGGIYEITRR